MVYNKNLVETIINPEYEKALPPLTDEEYHSLDESIRLRGLQNPITRNSKGVVLDGHNRYRICLNRDIEPKYTIKDFDTEEEEFQYVIESNLNRRQLNPFQKIECYSKLLKFYQERSKANQLAASIGEKIPYASSKGGAAVQFAKSLGMGTRRVQDALFILKHGDEKLKTQIRKGILTINSAKKILDSGEDIRKIKHNKAMRNVIGKHSILQCPKCFYEMSKGDIIVKKR